MAAAAMADRDPAAIAAAAAAAAAEAHDAGPAPLRRTWSRPSSAGRFASQPPSPAYSFSSSTRSLRDTPNRRSSATRRAAMRSGLGRAAAQMADAYARLHEISRLADELAASPDSTSTGFALIEGVSASSPAEEAGLMPFDRLLRVGEATVGEHLPLAISSNEGRPVEVLVWREGRQITLRLTPRKWAGPGLLGCQMIVLDSLPPPAPPPAPTELAAALAAVQPVAEPAAEVAAAATLGAAPAPERAAAIDATVAAPALPGLSPAAELTLETTAQAALSQAAAKATEISGPADTPGPLDAAPNVPPSDAPVSEAAPMPAAEESPSVLPEHEVLPLLPAKQQPPPAPADANLPAAPPAPLSPLLLPLPEEEDEPPALPAKLAPGLPVSEPEVSAAPAVEHDASNRAPGDEQPSQLLKPPAEAQQPPAESVPLAKEPPVASAASADEPARVAEVPAPVESVAPLSAEPPLPAEPAEEPPGPSVAPEAPATEPAVQAPPSAESAMRDELAPPAGSSAKPAALANDMPPALALEVAPAPAVSEIGPAPEAEPAALAPSPPPSAVGPTLALEAGVAPAPATGPDAGASQMSLLPGFAVIESVVEGSPAAEAGLLAGDRVLQFGDADERDELPEVVKASVGQPLAVYVLRGATEDGASAGEQLLLHLKPREWGGVGLLGCRMHLFLGPPAAPMGAVASPAKGSDSDSAAEAAPATEVASTPARPPLPGFAVVEYVTEGSPAARAGLLAGDRLLRFGDADDGNELAGVVQASIGQPLAVYVLRGAADNSEGQTVSLALTPQQWAGTGLLGCRLLLPGSTAQPPTPPALSTRAPHS